jgi:hypothetical protein
VQLFSLISFEICIIAYKDNINHRILYRFAVHNKTRGKTKIRNKIKNEDRKTSPSKRGKLTIGKNKSSLLLWTCVLKLHWETSLLLWTCVLKLHWERNRLFCCERVCLSCIEKGNLIVSFVHNKRDDFFFLSSIFLFWMVTLL